MVLVVNVSWIGRVCFIKNVVVIAPADVGSIQVYGCDDDFQFFQVRKNIILEKKGASVDDCSRYGKIHGENGLAKKNGIDSLINSRGT